MSSSDVCLSFQVIGYKDSFLATASSKGASTLDIARVTMCSVLYSPSKLLLCFTLGKCSSLVLNKEFFGCGDTSKEPPFLYIQQAMSKLSGKQ